MNFMRMYLQVDMKEMKRVHYVETLGKQYTSEFVQEFRIYFGNNGGDYQVSAQLRLCQSSLASSISKKLT